MNELLSEPSLPDFDSLWDYDHPAETEGKFRELLAPAESSGNNSYYAQLLTQIARAQGLQKKFEEAHRTLDHVERLLPASNKRTHVRYLLERGRVHNSSGNPSKSKPLFLTAWDMARDAGEDFYAVDAAHMIAIVEAPENQLDWNYRALEQAEKSEESRAKNWKGSLYNNIGWTLFEGKRYEEALGTFRKALEWRQIQGRTQEIRIAEWSVAKTLRFLDRTNEALEIQERLLAEYAGDGETSGYAFEEMAECLLQLGRGKEAENYFMMAYDVLSKDDWLRQNEPDRLKRLKALGSSASLPP